MDEYYKEKARHELIAKYKLIADEHNNIINKSNNSYSKCHSGSNNISYELDPNVIKPSEMYNQALRCIRDRKQQEVINILNDIIAKYPDSVEAGYAKSKLNTEYKVDNLGPKLASTVNCDNELAAKHVLSVRVNPLKVNYIENNKGDGMSICNNKFISWHEISEMIDESIISRWSGPLDVDDIKATLQVVDCKSDSNQLFYRIRVYGYERIEKPSVILNIKLSNDGINNYIIFRGITEMAMDDTDSTVANKYVRYINNEYKVYGEYSFNGSEIIYALNMRLDNCEKLPYQMPNIVTNAIVSSCILSASTEF